MKRRVADVVVDILVENNITQAYSVVGGGAMHLNNAFVLAKENIETVYNHHEQASAMAAESYARITGKMAAVCVTSGPGGLNTLNGVQGAWVDSIPMIIIAGHPRYNTTVEASGLKVRCIGVQENDIVTQVKNITKYSVLITDAKSIKRELQKAIDLAMTGRRGPVWISIPLDIQGEQVELDELYEIEPINCKMIEDEDVSYLIEELTIAKRPCILTGSGVRASGAVKEYREFLAKIQIPIVGGAFATDLNYVGEKMYYGGSGSIGPRCGNFILQNADLILVLGNSLSSSQTGFNVEAFAPNAKIIMVDAERDEAKKLGLHVNKCIVADLKQFFKAVCSRNIIANASSQWIDYCDYLKEELPSFEVLEYISLEDNEKVHPTLFWKKFMNKIEDDAIITLGNSSCIQGVLQEGVRTEKQKVIVNYHSGSMGIDLPFAVGASSTKKDGVYCVTGDGCIMMNLQELQTIVHHRYNVKIVIFSNNGYDNIRNTCCNYFAGVKNGCDSESGLSMPEFDKVANAFNIDYKHVKNNAELAEGIEWLVNNDKVCILEIDEKKAKERMPIARTVMDSNGKFKTEPLHIMNPDIGEERINKYMYMEEK